MLATPGFFAEASAAGFRGYGTSAPAAAAAGSVVAAASLAEIVKNCFVPCLEYELKGTSFSGKDWSKAVALCAARCGVAETPELMKALMTYIRGGAAAGAAEGGAEGGAAAGGVGLWWLIPVVAIIASASWIGWKYHLGGTAPPPSGPAAASGAGCGGILGVAPPPAKGWGVDAAHWSKTGCQAAIDDALVHAATFCATLDSSCGTCPPPRPGETAKSCKSLPVVDRVANQTHLFWCGARVHYRCGCFCV